MSHLLKIGIPIFLAIFLSNFLFTSNIIFLIFLVLFTYILKNKSDKIIPKVLYLIYYILMMFFILTSYNILNMRYEKSLIDNHNNITHKIYTVEKREFLEETNYTEYRIYRVYYNFFGYQVLSYSDMINYDVYFGKDNQGHYIRYSNYDKKYFYFFNTKNSN